MTSIFFSFFFTLCIAISVHLLCCIRYRLYYTMHWGDSYEWIALSIWISWKFLSVFQLPMWQSDRLISRIVSIKIIVFANCLDLFYCLHIDIDSFNLFHFLILCSCCQDKLHRATELNNKNFLIHLLKKINGIYSSCCLFFFSFCFLFHHQLYNFEFSTNFWMQSEIETSKTSYK